MPFEQVKPFDRGELYSVVFLCCLFFAVATSILLFMNEVPATYDFDRATPYIAFNRDKLFVCGLFYGCGFIVLGLLLSDQLQKRKEQVVSEVHVKRSRR